jgi:hypothetical protein
LASAAAFVSRSAFVLLMVKYRLGRKGSEWLFHAPSPPPRPPPRPHPGALFALLWHWEPAIAPPPHLPPGLLLRLPLCSHLLPRPLSWLLRLWLLKYRQKLQRLLPHQGLRRNSYRHC